MIFLNLTREEVDDVLIPALKDFLDKDDLTPFREDAAGGLIFDLMRGGHTRYPNTQ